MAECVEHIAESYEDATQVVLQGINMRVDPRKVLWCNYPVFFHGRDELEEKVMKDTRKLEKETGDNLRPDKLWYIGIPRFRLIRRGTPCLNCEVDLHYIACDADNEDGCWFGKIIPKADTFDVPLCLIAPLVEALTNNETEIKDVRVVERAPGYAIYEFADREWKVPDAFLGFLWALKEKGKGFEGLLDPTTCLLIERFAKELPSPERPRLMSGDDYQAVVAGLTNLGYNKTESEKAARYVIEKAPNESLEGKIKEALKYLSG